MTDNHHIAVKTYRGIVTLTHVIYALHAFSALMGILGLAFIVTAFLTGWPSIIMMITTTTITSMIIMFIMMLIMAPMMMTALPTGADGQHYARGCWAEEKVRSESIT